MCVSLRPPNVSVNPATMSFQKFIPMTHSAVTISTSRSIARRAKVGAVVSSTWLARTRGVSGGATNCETGRQSDMPRYQYLAL